ncbi:hypothetical protein ACFCV8_21815 [Streptomyces sp. NPDC056347]|uniref:hypothetical protein n=1 Tax=Streptomyces sp. NPDC056347 TaxID=3345790 RepID=UPI0035DEB4C3
MRHHTPRTGSRPARSGTIAHDLGWAADLRFAVHCSVVLLVLLVGVDGAAGQLTGPRTLLWAGSAALLCAVLVPPRVRAGAGWMSCRGLLRERTVRTDRLVSVRWPDGVAQRVVFRDDEGHRVEVDPEVLLANPALWHRLDTDARRSARAGTLRSGTPALRRLSERVDSRHAQRVFALSGLE